MGKGSVWGRIAGTSKEELGRPKQTRTGEGDGENSFSVHEKKAGLVYSGAAPRWSQNWGQPSAALNTGQRATCNDPLLMASGLAFVGTAGTQQLSLLLRNTYSPLPGPYLKAVH